MRINITLILMFLFLEVVGSIVNAQTITQPKKQTIPERHPTTISGLFLTNISQRSNKCVVVSGRSQFNNNFFLDSCIDGWTIKETNSIGYVRDLNFISDESGWMILNGSLIKVENNKLIEEDLEIIENQYFNKILFVDNQKGWAIGWKGQIIFTENGGKTWEEQNSHTNFNLDRIVFSTSEKGWIIGSNYEKNGMKLILLHTIDSGKTWTRVSQLQEKHFVKIFFLDLSNGWAITQNGAIAKTEDGGNTWKQNVAENVNFTDLFFVNKLTGWGITDNRIFCTKNGGVTWQIQFTLIDASPYDFNKIIFVDKNNGWVASQEKILQTTDGGKTWKSLQITEFFSAKTSKIEIM